MNWMSVGYLTQERLRLSEERRLARLATLTRRSSQRPAARRAVRWALVWLGALGRG